MLISRKMRFLREKAGLARPGAKTTVNRMPFGWFLGCLFAKKFYFSSFSVKPRKFRNIPTF